MQIWIENIAKGILKKKKKNVYIYIFWLFLLEVQGPSWIHLPLLSQRDAAPQGRLPSTHH